MASSNVPVENDRLPVDGSRSAVSHWDSLASHEEEVNQVVEAPDLSVKQEVSQSRSIGTDMQLNGVHHDSRPRASACPFHSPILDLRPPRSTTDDMTSIERYMDAAASEHPLSLSGNLSVGSAASAGCTCDQTPQAVIDDSTQFAIRELNAGRVVQSIVSAPNIDLRRH